MSITLELLQAAATGTSSRSGKTPFYKVSAEEAREYILIKDGNRKLAEDGSQALTVVIGKHTLPLDCIKAGTTRLAVTAEQVEPYTEALKDLIAEGQFDEAIVKAQGLAEIQASKPRAKPAAKADPVETEGLDLDELDAEEEVSEEL